MSSFAAARPPVAEWHAFAAPGDLAEACGDLAARAIEPNVFYEPAFLFPAAKVFGRDAGAVGVYGGDGTLAGLFPARLDNGRYGGAGAVMSGFVHPFGPLGTPVVDATHATHAIGAWLDYLAHAPDVPSILRLPLIPDDGPFAAALDRVLAKKGLPWRRFNQHKRAILRPGTNRARYIDDVISTRMRKELGRQRRRLAERGALEHHVSAGGDDIAAALEQFFVLEAKGWKGRAGTAAAQDADVRRFMHDAVTGLGREGKAQCDMLTAGGRAVASTIVLRSGATAWLWKIAYDESVRRFSPGVQLALDVTTALLADETIEQADSCATADHPMIDRLWSERLTLSDRLISLRPDRRFAFAAACTLESLRSAATGAARKLVALNHRRNVKPSRAVRGE